MKRYREFLLAIVLLTLPFIFYVSNSKETRDHNFLDRVVVFVSAPIQRVIVISLDGVYSVWQNYVNLIDVREENYQLKRENLKLRSELSKREEEHAENIRFRTLARLQSHIPDDVAIHAQVTAIAADPLFRSVRINRGSSDGIVTGSAVVEPRGILGRVIAVAHHYADVMLIVDSNSSLDVLVQRTRARARIHGIGGDGAIDLQLMYLSRTADVEPGDRIITSGLGTAFPKGLPVGVVSSVEKQAFGLYQSVRVEPSADFDRLEDVMVIIPETTYDIPPLSP